MEKNEEIKIRSLEKDDEAFIYSTWLKGLYYGNSWLSELPKTEFMQNYHQVIEKLLSKKEVSVRVACLTEDPSIILGYGVFEPPKNAIHWLYVKEAWRKFGIAKALIPNDTKWVFLTHLTNVGRDHLDLKRLSKTLFQEKPNG